MPDAQPDEGPGPGWLPLDAGAPRMNLLINAIKGRLYDVIEASGLQGKARVDYKTNAKGELVMAIIIPPSRPGEWGKPERARRP
jgi:hypothetical protein